VLFLLEIRGSPCYNGSNEVCRGQALFESEARAMMSYKKLWKILIDKDMKKKDLARVTGMSTYTLNKLNKGDNVTTEVLERICKALDCNIGDIMDVVPDEEKTN
jgi:DNA-binding Xre family transcriptional regulator